MKRAIPQVLAGDVMRREFDRALKENIEQMTGQIDGKIKPLSADATLADVIVKLNALMARLQ